MEAVDVFLRANPIPTASKIPPKFCDSGTDLEGVADGALNPYLARIFCPDGERIYSASFVPLGLASLSTVSP